MRTLIFIKVYKKKYCQIYNSFPYSKGNENESLYFGSSLGIYKFGPIEASLVAGLKWSTSQTLHL